MREDEIAGDAEAIIDTVQRLHGAQLLDVAPGDAGRHVLLLPEGIEAHSVKPYVDAYLTAPERRKGVAHVLDLGSFIAHTKRFADSDAVIFADPNREKPRLTAVLDYHRAGAEGAPRFGEHRTVYAMPLADEWRAWTACNNRPLSQADFAAFIEDRVVDIVMPDEAGQGISELIRSLDTTFATPVKLIELSRGLSVRQNINVTNAINLQTGEAQINYSSEHTDGKSFQPLKIPGAFLLGIPVFRGGDRFQLAARLRYRVEGTRVSFIYSLYRAEAVFDLAFQEACDEAAEQTSLPIYFGSPES